MPSLVPYIAFPGTCKEAMEFYASTLGGEITMMQTFAEAPMDVPQQLHHRIFNSELKAGSIHIKASDDLPGHEVSVGTNISLFGIFQDKETKEEVFTKLSEGGKVLFPLTDNFGMLKDKYGIQWMVVHETDEP